MEPIQISKARDCLGELAGRVVFGKERIILSRNNKRLALIPIEDLEALEAMEDDLDIKLAIEAKKECEELGTTPWEEIKKELGLCNTESTSHLKREKTQGKSRKIS